MALPPPKNILIFGATGGIGTYITSALLSAKSNSQSNSESNFNRIAIFTSASTLEKKGGPNGEIEKLKSQGVEIFVGSLDGEGWEEGVRGACDGIDTIISCLGRSSLHLQIPLLRLASTIPSITRFYPSEYGTDIDYSPASAYERPHQQKLKVRRFVEHELSVSDGKTLGDEENKARGKDRALEITYLVTGPFADMFLYPPVPGNEGAGGFDVKNHKAYVIGDGEGKVSFTSMRDVGTLLVASLLHPDPETSPEVTGGQGTTTANTPTNERGLKVRTLKVNSFTTTPLEIVRAFEHATGGKWEVQHMSIEEVKKIEAARWDEGSPIATLWTLKRIWAEGGTLYEKRDNDRIGNPGMEGLGDLVARTGGVGGEEGKL